MCHNGNNFLRIMNKPQTKICFSSARQTIDCHRVIIKLDPAEISYVTLIFEAYDFIGVPRTIDRKNGILEALVSPDFAEDARALVKALKSEIGRMEIITM